jgi:putative ABC transport system ATP-binding protein
MNKPVLSFHSVSKRFFEEDPILSEVSFTIQAGEFTALAGSSGSGKTTALNLAAGLDYPSVGTIELLGQDLTSLTRKQLTNLRRESVGFVFQSYNLFPVLSALENVEYPLALKKVAVRERRERAKAILKEVGLEGLEKRMPNQLSGGQQQRVAIARAMVTDPLMVFADEPTANVDARTAETLLLLFRRLNEVHGTTFLFSSHDPMVLSMARRLIHLSSGRIVKDAPRAASKPVITRPALSWS